MRENISSERHDGRASVLASRLTATNSQPSLLRQAVLHERSTAFDIGSRAMMCKSLEVLSGHERKVRELLAQCSLETRVYLEHLWDGWRAGGMQGFTATDARESLPKFSIYHWLFEAMRGFAEEAQAVVMPELLEHYRAAMEDTPENLPEHLRQQQAIMRLGDAGEVNRRLRKQHLTDAEKQRLLNASGSRGTLLILAAFISPLYILPLVGVTSFGITLFWLSVSVSCAYLFWPSLRARVRPRVSNALWLEAFKNFLLGMLILPILLHSISIGDRNSFPQVCALMLQILGYLLAALLSLRSALRLRRKLAKVNWLEAAPHAGAKV